MVFNRTDEDTVAIQHSGSADRHVPLIFSVDEARITMVRIRKLVEIPNFTAYLAQTDFSLWLE